MLFLVPALILTSWARECVAVDLPWEILESICNSSDDINPQHEEVNRQVADRYFSSNPVPQPQYEADLAAYDIPSESSVWTDVPHKIHEKNKLIFSMSHVCQSWRAHLVNSKRLWRDIAFVADTSSTGVRLATLFLAKVENDDVPLRIYAGLPFGDHPDPTIIALLSKLRQHTHRWETFIYSGRLNPYRHYLDLPAPRLQYFSDNHDISHLYLAQTTQLFAGHAPILRSLITSSLRSWHPVTFLNLRVFDLWDCDAGLSIRLLLGVLRCTPQLEEMTIVSPNPPLYDCPPGDLIDLPHLKVLKVKNPDFYTIIGLLSVPNVQITTVSSVYHRRAPGMQTVPAFEASHPFVGLVSMTPQLPMIGQPIVLASLVVDRTLTGFLFTISIATERNEVLYVDLEWTGGVGIHSKTGYIERSISALSEMHFLSGALLQITVPTCGFLINYTNPLFCLRTIEHFTVEGEKLRTLLKVLDGGQTQRLPNLKLLSIPEEDDLTDKDIRSIPKFLRLRENLVMAFSTDNHQSLVRLLSRVCVIEGKFAPPPPQADTVLNLSSTERLTLIPTQGAHPLIHVRLRDQSPLCITF